MKKKLIGIDLGTTNCCIAWMNGSQVVVYQDELGRSTIPSIVAQTHDGEILVGWRAKNCENPLYRHGFSKRALGSSQKFPFKHGSVPAYEVSGMVLAELKRLAEQKLGGEVAAVITVPAHFLAMHREETRKAAEYAKLEVIELLQEPIAAALAYYNEAATRPSALIPQTETILVYDLGGGTMDATVCVRRGEHIEIGDHGKAYEGDKFLGGIDFDKALVAMAANQLEGQGLTAGTIGDDLPSSQWLWELLSAAERCKQRLSDESEVQWSKELISSEKRVMLNLWVTRNQFEQSISHLIDKTLDCCDQALMTQVRRLTPANYTRNRQDLLKIAAEKLNRIVLVGGSTLMPVIKRRVQEHYEEICGHAPETGSFRPYECVAIGAAMFAALSREVFKEDGIEWLNGPPADVGQEVEIHPELWGTVTACNGPGWHIEVEVGAHKQHADIQANGRFHLSSFPLASGENPFRLTIFDQHGNAHSSQSRTLNRGGFTIGDPGLAQAIRLRLIDGMEELIPAGTRSGGAASKKTFYINDRQEKARIPLYEGHYPIAKLEFPTDAEPGTPVTFHTLYKQGRLKLVIELGSRMSEEREVDLEISHTRERDALVKDFTNLLQETEFLLRDLPLEGELSENLRREWQALKLDIETEFANRIVLDLNRIEDRVCQLAMLQVQLQSYSTTPDGLRRQAKETRDMLRDEIDLLKQLDPIEAEITDDKQPDELAALAAQLRELWRNYYQRHPPQIDRGLVEFTVKQLRNHLEAVKRDAEGDDGALTEALDLEQKLSQIMQSEDYPAVFNRLSIYEAKHVNPLYQRVVIRKSQQGLLRSTR